MPRIIREKERKYMAVMSMKQVVAAVNNQTEIKIYKDSQLIAKGNRYQEQILRYIHELNVEADLDAITNVCTVILPVDENVCKNYIVLFMNARTGKVGFDIFTDPTPAAARGSFHVYYRHDNYKILSVVEKPEIDAAKRKGEW